MAIDFFLKEQSKVQDRFNETFGKMQVVNLEARSSVILSIVYLGMLAKKLGNKRNKAKDIDMIKEFMKVRQAIHRVLDSAQKNNSMSQKGKEKESCNQKSSTRFVRSAKA